MILVTLPSALAFCSLSCLPLVVLPTWKLVWDFTEICAWGARAKGNFFWSFIIIAQSFKLQGPHAWREHFLKHTTVSILWSIFHTFLMHTTLKLHVTWVCQLLRNFRLLSISLWLVNVNGSLQKFCHVPQTILCKLSWHFLLPCSESTSKATFWSYTLLSLPSALAFIVHFCLVSHSSYQLKNRYETSQNLCKGWEQLLLKFHDNFLAACSFDCENYGSTKTLFGMQRFDFPSNFIAIAQPFIEP